MWLFATVAWTPTVHALLRHLETVGFDGAPRVVGSRFDPAGRETLTFIQGDFIDPDPWTIEGATSVGTWDIKAPLERSESTRRFARSTHSSLATWCTRALSQQLFVEPRTPLIPLHSLFSAATELAPLSGRDRRLTIQSSGGNKAHCEAAVELNSVVEQRADAAIVGDLAGLWDR